MLRYVKRNADCLFNKIQINFDLSDEHLWYITRNPIYRFELLNQGVGLFIFLYRIFLS